MAAFIGLRPTEIDWTVLDQFLCLGEPVDRRPREGVRLEFKAQMVDELGKTVAAMANTEGGTILIGVAEDRHHADAAGSLVRQSAATLGRVVNHIASNVSPRPEYEVELVAPPGAIEGVVVLRVEPGSETPYVFRGRDVHVRLRGANDRPTRDELIALVSQSRRDSRKAAHEFADAEFLGHALRPLVPSARSPGQNEQWTLQMPTIRVATGPLRPEATPPVDHITERAFEAVALQHTVGRTSIQRETRIWDLDAMEFDVDCNRGPTPVRWRMHARHVVGLGWAFASGPTWDVQESLERCVDLVRVVRPWDAETSFAGGRWLSLDLPEVTMHATRDLLGPAGRIDIRPTQERSRILGFASSVQHRFHYRLPGRASEEEWLAGLVGLWFPALRQRSWLRGTPNGMLELLKTAMQRPFD